jgi:NAD(P) transhydrogenase subunit alpha
MYARNALALLQHVAKDGRLQPDLADEIVRGVTVVHDGRITHEGLRKEHGGDPG